MQTDQIRVFWQGGRYAIELGRSKGFDWQNHEIGQLRIVGFDALQERIAGLEVATTPSGHGIYCRYRICVHDRLIVCDGLVIDVVVYDKSSVLLRLTHNLCGRNPEVEKSKRYKFNHTS